MRSLEDKAKKRERKERRVENLETCCEVGEGVKLLRMCELIGCLEMGKRQVSECNKGKGICVIYYLHYLFSLVFLPNWEDKIL